MREVYKVRQPKPTPVKKRVAAYARVSKETERLEHSLAAQISYYSKYIQKNPNWEYAGVYTDSFITGTLTKSREGFKDLIRDCDMGKIDIVLVKSISRFARNTIDLLNTVRHLKDIGVEVIFEKESISTMSKDGEFLLTVLASFAQEEVRSTSENIKWAVRKKFEQGIPSCHFKILGYEWHGDELSIVPSEAEIVRKIYNDYLLGSSIAEMVRELENTVHNLTYHRIRDILSNETYTGKLILQKTFSSDPITKKNRINKGELPMYVVDDNHEAIIDRDTFDKVQLEIKRRAALGAVANKFINTSSMTGKIKCGRCGSNYIRETVSKEGVYFKEWRCRMKLQGREPKCKAKNVPERFIIGNFEKICGQSFEEDLFKQLIEEVIIIGNDTIEYHFRDGTIVPTKWESTGNKDRWTAEERMKKSEFAKAHPINKHTATCFTSKIQCGCCGENFRKSYIPSSGRYSWGCSTGKRKCGIRWIREEELKRVISAVLNLQEFDEDSFTELTDHIVINSNDELTVCFKDGTEHRSWWNSKRIKRQEDK